MFIFSQVIGSIAFCLFIYSIQRKEKSEVLFFQIFSFLLYTIQYISANAIVGAIIYFINAIRSLLFYILERKSKNTNLYFILFLFVVILYSFMTYDNIYDIFPLIATINSVFFMWQKKIKIIRIGQIVSCIMWIVYNLFNHVYVGVITEALVIISCIRALFKYNLQFKKITIKLYINLFIRCDKSAINFSPALPVVKHKIRSNVRIKNRLTEKHNYGKIEDGK